MLLSRLHRTSIGLRQQCQRAQFTRLISTLPTNSRIYYFSDPENPTQYLITLLPTSPPTSTLAIGRTPAIPPESNPSSFQENPDFLPIVQSILKANAIYDPNTQASAAAYASQAGANLSGGFIMPPSHPSSQRSRPIPSTSGGGPTASEGGAGGAGRGGWVHVSDQRKPPDFGRIADPEDIFGTVEVDGEGAFVGQGGNYQESGTYRIVTRDGVLGLSDFLMQKLVERLKQLESERKA